MKKKWLNLFLVLLFSFNGYLFAQEEEMEEGDKISSSEKSSDISKQSTLLSNIEIRGSGYILMGEIKNGYAYGRAGSNPVRNHWQNFYGGRFDLISSPTKWYKTKVSLQIESDWPILRVSNIMKETYNLKYRSILPQAVGVFDFKFDELPISSIVFESGLMEYAFNEEVKNLGNYLYRSTAYPFNLDTRLDYIYSSLLGGRVEVGLLKDMLKGGIICNSIINTPPLFDMNLAFYFSYVDPLKFFDGGIAFSFDHLVATDGALTDAKNLRSILGDSTLTFRSQKIDLRLAFDFKKLLGENKYFGEKDLKLYTEAALIGLKDPNYFPEDSTAPAPSLLNRLPILIGLNLPAFKILDLFSIELEWCKYPYSFDWWGNGGSVPSPKPNNNTSDTLWQKIYRDEDNLKWTLYLKKSIKKFDIIAFIANDHIRYRTYSAEAQFYPEQSLRRGGFKNFHWYIKLQYNL